MDRLYTVLPLTVCAAAVVLAITMPDTEALPVSDVLRLALDRFRTVLPEIELVPADTKIPLITPAAVASALLVAFAMLATVLPEMMTVPVPALWMPYTDWILVVVLDAELALMLLAVVVLPIVLLLMVVVPAEADLKMPKKLVAFVDALTAVIAPMVLFWQSTTSVLAMLMP